MSISHQPHDKYFKASLKERQIAVDFVEIHSDIVYRCQFDGKDGYIPILFLLEAFSTAPTHIAFHLLQYVVNLMNDALKAGSKKLPLVLPLCVYHGETSPFPQSTDIYDDFDDPDLARAMMFKPFSLIDLTTLP